MARAVQTPESGLSGFISSGVAFDLGRSSSGVFQCGAPLRGSSAWTHAGTGVTDMWPARAARKSGVSPQLVSARSMRCVSVSSRGAKSAPYTASLSVMSAQLAACESPGSFASSSPPSAAAAGVCSYAAHDLPSRAPGQPSLCAKRA